MSRAASRPASAGPPFAGSPSKCVPWQEEQAGTSGPRPRSAISWPFGSVWAPAVAHRTRAARPVTDDNSSAQWRRPGGVLASVRDVRNADTRPRRGRQKQRCIRWKGYHATPVGPRRATIRCRRSGSVRAARRFKVACPLQALAHRRRRYPQPPPDLATGNPGAKLQTQNLAHLAHRNPLRWHPSPQRQHQRSGP